MRPANDDARLGQFHWMVSEFHCRWDKLKKHLQGGGGSGDVGSGSGGSGSGGSGGRIEISHGGGGAGPLSAHPGTVYETEAFDGRSEINRDPEGVWVSPDGVKVLTLRWAKTHGPGLQPLFAQVASFVGFDTPTWEVGHQKDHAGGSGSWAKSKEETGLGLGVCKARK